MATLAQRLQDLATRIATECKALRTLVNGNAVDLSSLTTTAKTNLVAALNEVRALAVAAQSSGGATINDAATNTTNVWSSQKTQDTITNAINVLTTGAPGAMDTLDELAAALGDDANFAASMTTALSNRVRHDTAAQGLTATQQGNARTNIGAQDAASIGNTDQDLVAAFNAALV